MLTLLFASRFDLAAELQAAADEVFGLALTLCPRDHLVTIHRWKALMHSKQMGYGSRRVHHLVLWSEQHLKRNENNRVTRVVNSDTFSSLTRSSALGRQVEPHCRVGISSHVADS